MKPDDCWKLLSLQKKNDRQHMNLLSSVTMGPATWSEVLRIPPAKGLKFSIINTEVPAALLAWYKAESGGKGADDEEAVQHLLEKKGIVVRESGEETELMPAIQRWNEKKKHLCEYSHLSCLFPHERSL